MGFELTPAFWSGLTQIILVNIILSGDNALVIALACRNLEKKHQRPAIIIGSGGAILLRILFVLIVDYLLSVPFLKLVGGMLLLWIGVKLVQGEEEGEDEGGNADAELERPLLGLGPLLLLSQLGQALLAILLLTFTLFGTHEVGRLAVRR